MTDQVQPGEKAPNRKRSMTSLTLSWMAERMRRAQQIKEQVASGAYRVNSEQIAAALVNEEAKNSS